MRLVIVGGGFAGAAIAKQLEQEFDVTLIDTKDYFEFTPGILRTLVEPGHAKKIQVLHESYLTRARVIQGAATKVTKTHVLVGKDMYPYDYLVLASGCVYNRPFKQANIISAERARILRNHHEDIEQSKNILIVGGGIVGVELAGEIVHKYPHINVTIVHSRDELVPRGCPRVKKHIQKFMDKNKVRLVFNERLQRSTRSTFITDKETRIHADFAFLCVGIRPNSEYLKDFAPLDERGFVKVQPTLLMEGATNVFIAGDLTGVVEEKLAQNAELHAKIVVQNLRLAKQQLPLIEYKTGQRASIISLGPKDGVFSYKEYCITGRLAAFMKDFVELLGMRKFK